MSHSLTHNDLIEAISLVKRNVSMTSTIDMRPLEKLPCIPQASHVGGLGSPGQTRAMCKHEL